MSKGWDKLFEEASHSMEQWRGKHKKATLTEIENTVDKELARVRAQMIQDLALASETADLTKVPSEERPQCPVCGEALTANGQQERTLMTDHEQPVKLKRSKGYCPQCDESFSPSR